MNQVGVLHVKCLQVSVRRLDKALGLGVCVGGWVGGWVGGGASSASRSAFVVPTKPWGVWVWVDGGRVKCLEAGVCGLDKSPWQSLPRAWGRGRGSS
jgi:hypothetical protein